MRCSFADNVLLALVLLGLSGCNSETAIKEQQPDPVLEEYPVVYIQRDLASTDEDDNPAQFEARNPARFNAGASLLFKPNAFTDSPVTVLTQGLFTDDAGVDLPIDIRDLTVSDDGQSFLVSIRAPHIEGLDDDEQPKWNIWRFDLEDKTLKPVMVDSNIAEQADDLMPSFLPDGRIVFSSTRQRLSRAILLDEGKPQYTALTEARDTEAFNIHVMDDDGSNIKQLSFNLSHEFYPLIMQDGQILFSRWDRMGGDHGINLYTMAPDGTDSQLVFGWHSHQLNLDEEQIPLDYLKTQQLANGEIFMMLAPTDNSHYQKRPLSINLTDFTDHEQLKAQANVTGVAVNNLSFNFDFDFSQTDAIAKRDRITHLYPLQDNSDRYLLSLNLCRVVQNEVIKSCGQLTDEELMDENITHAPPRYELWLYDNVTATMQVVAKALEGLVITESIVMRPSLQPKSFVADKVVGNELDAELYNELAGAIDIRSVYDFDGQDTSPGGLARASDPSLTPASNLPARFLRIERGVPMPPDEVRDIPNTDFGRSANQLMREIIGYTPIQPDGSVKVKVPANVPMSLSVVDINGRRIGARHQQWFSVRSGETLQCMGCHTRNSTLPHGQYSAQADSINTGAQGGFAFPNTTQDIIPIQGQTMAQADAMVNGIATLTSGLNYQDKWTNPAISAVNPSIEVNHANLATLAPNGNACFNQWNAYCRIQINYEEHIQPLWDLPRQVVDEVTGELIADNTCTSCHSVADTEGLAQVPAGQLELVNTPSSDQVAHLTSYRELFFNDVEQEVIEGILVDKLVPLLDANGNIVYQVDSNGDLILDENGNPIPVLTTVNVPSILSTNGARASQGFFEAMSNPTHAQILSAEELKLISEWLDIGAQYYNTPFYPQD